MHVAINDHELPPRTIKSINLLDDGLSFTRGESKTDSERLVIEKILGTLSNGDIVEYHMRASNDRLAIGKARINRITLCNMRYPTREFSVYAFELEPLKKIG